MDELWVVRGRNPVMWTVPFYVRWDGHEAEMFYAVPLMAKQEAAVKEVLNTAARPFNGMWRITRHSLKQIGYEVQPGDPQGYFSWERPRRAQEHEFEPEKREERDDFLDALYQRGVGTSRDEVEFWYNAICNHMLDWLLNKEKPVDLYFAKLHMSPYRQNWKQILISRFPRLGRGLCATSGPARDAFVIQSGLADELMSFDLLAMSRQTGCIYRHLEVEMLPAWWKANTRVEKSRYVALKPFTYAVHVMDSIRRRLKVTVRLYTQWLTAIARPSAVDVEGGYAGQYRIAPNIPPSQFPSYGLKTFYVPSVVSNKLEPKSATYAENLYEKNGPLPDMSNFRQRDKDMRNRGDLFLKSAIEEEGDAGMLVLHADKSGDKGKVLAETGGRGKLDRTGTQ